MTKIANRRPLKSRENGWVIVLVRLLLRTPLAPNTVSVSGIAAAAAGAACLLAAPTHPLAWLGAALCIQLRLLANLVDGLLAIEGGRKSATGGLFNEFPDRIEDSLLLVAAGQAAGQPVLGWAAALGAMATAYTRALGGSLGLAQDFGGPMAKPQRMALLTAAALASLALPVLPIALAIIIAGSALTCLRRLLHQARLLTEAAR